MKLELFKIVHANHNAIIFVINLFLKCDLLILTHDGHVVFIIHKTTIRKWILHPICWGRGCFQKLVKSQSNIRASLYHPRKKQSVIYYYMTPRWHTNLHPTIHYSGKHGGHEILILNFKVAAAQGKPSGPEGMLYHGPLTSQDGVWLICRCLGVCVHQNQSIKKHIVWFIILYLPLYSC